MTTQHEKLRFSASEPRKNGVGEAELELILQSHGFRRSERHSRYLRFVCEATLGGEITHLNEYLPADLQK